MENCTKCNLAHPRRVACSLAIEAAKEAKKLTAPEVPVLTAAQRTSERMKAYWAEKKGQKATA